MNYSNMILACERPSSKEEVFEFLTSKIFAVEEMFQRGSDVRKALFEARRSVTTAKFLFRLEEETGEKEKRR